MGLDNKSLPFRDSYEALLIEYAAGILDQAQNLIVAAHLTLSPPARDFVRRCEAVGGYLMEQHCQPVQMKKGSLECVMGKLDTPHHSQKQMAGNSIFPDDIDIPEPLQRFICCQPNQPQWRHMHSGLESFELILQCKKSVAHFMKASPKIETSRIDDVQTEITLVLDGAISRRTEIYKRGDLIIIEENVECKTVSCRDHGCITMVVTERIDQD